MKFFKKKKEPSLESSADHIKFRCPACQEKFAVPKSAGGKKIRCPKCAVKFSIPFGLGTASPSPADTSKAPTALANEVLEMTIRDLKETNRELEERLQAAEAENARLRGLLPDQNEVE